MRLVRKLVVPTVRCSFCSVWVAALGRVADHVGDGDVAAEHADRAQQEEGDHGQRHQEHDQEDDEPARPLLALELLGVGWRAAGVARDGHWSGPSAGTAWVAPTVAIMEVTPGSAASTGRPSAKRRRSARSSSADPYRSSGFLAIAFMTTASSAAGTAGLTSAGQDGGVAHVLRGDGHR